MNIEKKFIESFEVSDWEVLSPNGFTTVKSTHKTIPYQEWFISTGNFSLKCADNHILFNTKGEVFAKDIIVGDTIITRDGLQVVTEAYNTNTLVNMYDLQVNSFDQSYFTNGILSHNTASSALYLLWYAMFIPDTTILIAAHKRSGAIEIMDRIRYAYESCEDFIRAGVTTYSTERIVFDNKSRILAQATTENTGRGLSISLLYCLDKDTKVTVKDKESGEIKELSLEGLYTDLENDILEKIEQNRKMRIVFTDNSFIEVFEDESLLVDDIKTTIEHIIHGSEVLVGNDYCIVKEIDYA